MRVAVLQDPAHPYAAEFIRVLADDMGLPTVALWTNPQSRRRYGGRYPILGSCRVRADYATTSIDADQIIARLRADNFEPAAFVPFVETGVAVAGELARSAGISWGGASDWSMFRDKCAVKACISRAGGIRVNRFTRVAGTEAVVEELGRWGCDRFVLKPNDGFGNSRVAAFDSHVDRRDLDDYFHRVGADILMEEFLFGEEFYVNGHADERGDPHVFLIGRYTRQAVNGRHNLEVGATTIRTTDPRFGVLSAYTQGIVRTLGLRRSPFHAEVMLDDDGPCLIEIAARLSGAGDSFTTRRAHRGRLDPFGIAAHHYVLDEPTCIEPDWRFYDSRLRVTVTGVSKFRGRLWSVPNLPDVERLPGFVTWLDRPRLGQRIKRTEDLSSATYSAELTASSQEEARLLAAQVERLMQFNPSSGRVRTMARGARALAVGAHGRTRGLGLYRRRLRRLNHDEPGRVAGGAGDTR